MIVPMEGATEVDPSAAAGPAAERNTRPPTRKGRAMRERLLRAARECFERDGYHRTGVPDITSAAGSSHGTFYRYFVSVDDVLLAALTPVMDELFAASERPRGADAHEIEQIEGWALRFQTVYSANRLLLRTLVEAAASDRTGAFAKSWLAVRTRFIVELEAWITETWLRTGHTLRDIAAADLAEALGSMNEQMVYIRLCLPTEPPDDAELRRLRNMIAVMYRRATVGCLCDDGRTAGCAAAEPGGTGHPDRGTGAGELPSAGGGTGQGEDLSA